MSTTGVSEHMSVSGPIDLTGRVAIVTGAARGIGQAIACALAREGADVVAADLLSVDETVSDVRGRGRRTLGAACDVTKSADVAAVVKSCLDEFGKIDILVNNAGVLTRTGLEETTEEILTILPYARAFIAGNTALVIRYAPVITTSTSRYQISSVVSSSPVRDSPPAVFTRMSIFQNSSRQLVTT